MENTIVLYPAPWIGHLIPMVELGKLLLRHEPSFSITIFINTSLSPYTNNAAKSYINHVAATTSAITFHHLLAVELPPPTSELSFLEHLFDIPRLSNPYAKHALQNISEKSNMVAVILDFLCNAAFRVSSELGIPTYYLYTSAASALCVFLYSQTIHESIDKNIKEVDDYFQFPGTPPIYSMDIPGAELDRENRVYKLFLETSKQIGKSSGILVNSFEELEPRAKKALSDGLCIPKAPTPPVHCIGPLIASRDQSEKHECLSWLDLQPTKSVVFLCFGSVGLFSAEQLVEMAAALENSGCRFLWVVRDPGTSEKAMLHLSPAEPDLDAFLPQGFLERTRDRGMVVKSWAPQVEVLNHDSVGGFVTHCGWNSVLEAIYAGVPMLAWPLYAEQRMNRVFIVEEIKVALGLTELENGFVTAIELEMRVRELMDPEFENGKLVRERVMSMRNCAKAVHGDGGSSYMAFEELIKSWTKG